MKYLTLLPLLLFFLSSYGQTSAKLSNEEESSKSKIKVYLLGTFHFAQTDDTYNVLDKKHQKSIEKLSKIIVKQKPSKIFVERQPEFESQNKIDSLYNFYLTMSRPLRTKNEIFQVGFRVAKSLGHSKVYQCDHPGQYGRYIAMATEYAEKNNQTDILKAERIGTVKRYDEIVDEDAIMENSTLLEYLQFINSDRVMRTSHAHYITIYPQIGSTNYYDYDDEDTLIGAKLTADWYRRNIMIYSKIINQLTYEENAIFLLMGGDHIPIIKSLFEANPYFEVISPDKWLK